uniref:Saposin B-type domain-containing protein n=1 Tax=Pseudonaja textilis TaxID=8673 RepID=A0A670Z0H3_PSETE
FPPSGSALRRGRSGRPPGRNGRAMRAAAGCLVLAGALALAAAGLAGARESRPALERLLPAVGARFGWTNFSCPACRLLFSALDLETSVEHLQQLAAKVCVTLKLAPPDVCQEATRLFGQDMVTAWVHSVLISFPAMPTKLRYGHQRDGKIIGIPALDQVLPPHSPGGLGRDLPWVSPTPSNNNHQ